MSKFRKLGYGMAIVPWGLITMPLGLTVQLVGLGVQFIGLFIIIQLARGKIR